VTSQSETATSGMGVMHPMYWTVDPAMTADALKDFGNGCVESDRKDPSEGDRPSKITTPTTHPTGSIHNDYPP
jgi:hypothetical protein